MPQANETFSGLTDTWGRRNRKLADKQCKECGGKFRPRTSKSRYCCRRCAWKNNGGNARPEKTFAQHVIRFWSLVKRGDGCWKWLGTIRKGYGRFATYRWSKQAHLMAYELTNGPVPKGKELDHTCENKWCCNPAHCEPVTHQENILRHFQRKKAKQI